MGQRSVLRPPFFAKEFYWHSHQNAKSKACREFVYAPAQRFITFPQEAYWHTHENGQSKACRRFFYVYAPAQRFGDLSKLSKLSKRIPMAQLPPTACLHTLGPAVSRYAAQDCPCLQFHGPGKGV